MKLQFKNQDFQTAAVEAVTGLFAGQERSRATFSVMNEGQLAGQNSYMPAELGVGNVLRLSDETLTENMRAIQKRNLLPMTDSAASRQFCIEMETGTGKTYVYTKTIFELHHRRAPERGQHPQGQGGHSMQMKPHSDAPAKLEEMATRWSDSGKVELKKLPDVSGRI